jgi:hypothetical protein
MFLSQQLQHLCAKNANREITGIDGSKIAKGRSGGLTAAERELNFQ